MSSPRTSCLPLSVFMDLAYYSPGSFGAANTTGVERIHQALMRLGAVRFDVQAAVVKGASRTDGVQLLEWFTASHGV